MALDTSFLLGAPDLNVVLLHVDLCAYKLLLARSENVFSVCLYVSIHASAAASSVVVAAVVVVVFVDALVAAVSVVVALVGLAALLVAAMLAIYTFRCIRKASACFVDAPVSLCNRHWCFHFSAFRRTA